jgi:hypothetical protein
VGVVVGGGRGRRSVLWPAAVAAVVCVRARVAGRVAVRSVLLLVLLLFWRVLLLLLLLLLLLRRACTPPPCATATAAAFGLATRAAATTPAV